MTDRKAIRSRLLASSLALGFAVVGIISGCNGSSDSSTPPATATTVSTTPPPTTTAVAASLDGAALFTQNCSRCHGDKGAGGKRAPVLAGRHLAEADVTKTVADGKGRRMPSFKTRLKGDQITAIAKFVASL